MRKLIKTIGTTLIMLMAVMLLAACGGGNNEGSTSAPQNVDPSPAPPAVEPITPLPIPEPTSEPMQPTEPEVGDLLAFGGREWRVLDMDGDYALVLHETVMSGRIFHDHGADGVGLVGWTGSDIRSWLNEEFFNSFSEVDRERIRETYVINNDNPILYGPEMAATHPHLVNTPRGPGVANTTDRIFLLSIDEMLQYFGNSDFVLVTNEHGNQSVDDQYNVARIAYNAEGEASWWWLRSPGAGWGVASSVRSNGSLSVSGYSHISALGVRPALWLNFEGLDITPQRPSYITILGEQFSTSLTELNLSRWPIVPLTNEDIVPLRYMTNLTSLSLDNALHISDLTPLSGLTNLTHLGLGNNQISDISPLAGLTNLTLLHLTPNQISDITPLAGLTNLTELYLGSNQISDITPLAGLTNLWRVSLVENPVTDWSPVAHVQEVPGRP